MIDALILFLQIMLINIVLSGDNAVVIALASKNLPLAQRKLAIWWGAFGAIALRLILTLVAVSLLDIPYIQAGGSLLLFWIAIKLLTDDDSHANVKEASTLGKAIWTIVVADFVMSLDNVLAIAAKGNGNNTVIILGIGLSIPIIIWGSTLVMDLLHRFPILVFMGAGILGYTAGEMFVKDEKMIDWLLHDYESLHVWIPIVAASLVIMIGLTFKWVRLLPFNARNE
ncbi:TerC family protein [Paenibacillus frigoriresistens]|jgi:YjbE family integral membrane protein|uniref:TerC family protein n=1 Tax=Paenibacillus alginolyticus TaxID=59839 RepID=UPI001565502C|nr:TerC family protein [Paenibacillus frigoriresistens]NRF91813.1 TerC family protein [Paenibacillus frigoriresistens]